MSRGPAAFHGLRPLRRLYEELRRRSRAIERRLSVRILGHRKYVGGRWDEIGELQFRALVERGLEPRHHLLDIACGSLRGGVRFIPYLEEGHYMGVEKERELLERGVEEELGRALLKEKRPQLICTGEFDFSGLRAPPEYALAQSLFTHLVEADIRRCLSALRRVIAPEGRFYATFFETDVPVPNRSTSHALLRYAYTRDQMERMGRETGWRMTYIGEWGHPKDQRLLLYEPA